MFRCHLGFATDEATVSAFFRSGMFLIRRQAGMPVATATCDGAFIAVPGYGFAAKEMLRREIAGIPAVLSRVRLPNN